MSQHAATEVLTALWSDADTCPLMLSVLMGSAVKQQSQMNSVYLCRDVARHLSTLCEDLYGEKPPIKTRAVESVVEAVLEK